MIELTRTLDEVEMLIANLPQKMAEMHFTEGYAYEKRNPYGKLSPQFNQYENHFLNLQLKGEYK